jgi:nucleotide-binding universal stress UspA family protein
MRPYGAVAGREPEGERSWLRLLSRVGLSPARPPGRSTRCSTLMDVTGLGINLYHGELHIAGHTAVTPIEESGSLRLVILASDFSAGARRALRRVQHLPFSESAEVLVLHVLSRAERHPAAAKESSVRLEREVQLLRLAFRRRSLTDVSVRGVMQRGRPAAETSRLARQTSADLLVLGRRGAGGVRRLLLGSTAERVATRHDAPVLVVGASPRGPFAVPLVAAAPDESARAVLDAALRVIPAAVRADVVGAAHVPMEASLWGAGIGSKEMIRLRSVVAQRTRAALLDTLTAYRALEQKPRLTIEAGDPREVILTVARRNKADLIVVGTQAGGQRPSPGGQRLRVRAPKRGVRRPRRADHWQAERSGLIRRIRAGRGGMHRGVSWSCP